MVLYRPVELARQTGNLGTGTNLYGFGVYRVLALIEALARSKCVHLQLGSYRPSGESVPAVAKEFHVHSAWKSPALSMRRKVCAPK